MKKENPDKFITAENEFFYDYKAEEYYPEYMGVCSATDSTGSVPAAPRTYSELEAYDDVGRFEAHPVKKSK